MKWPATAGLGLAVLALAACSSGRRAAQFTLDGVTAPPKVCSLDPEHFAQSEKVPDFREANGCGVSNAYRIYTINDIGLSQSALLNCDMADAVSGWLAEVVQPMAQSAYGQRVVAIKVAASYACRPRSNQYGAKLSEHGFGNALDIAGFTLSDGREVSVLRDYYNGGADSVFLRGIRSRACGMFNTVLGPGSDANHRDHLHLDKMFLRKGRGTYCH